MGADHVHVTAGMKHRRPLTIAFGLVVVFMIVEVWAGLATGSLALLSDAGHMATDTLGLGMALAAITAGARAPAGRRTFGLYRIEVLAGLANAALLFVVAGYVLWEAVGRIRHPVDVLSGPMLVVAVLGLVVNLISWRLLRAGAEESLNVEGAYMEVVADLLGSIGVIVAGAIIRLTGWTYADPLIGAAIGLFILPRAWRLARQALSILVEVAPVGLDLEEIAERLRAIPTVDDIHDLHVWTVTSGMEVATVHLVIADGADPHPVLDRARHMLGEDYGIDHATLQVEPASHEGCTELTW